MFISFRSYQTGEIIERCKNVKVIIIDYDNPENDDSLWVRITTYDDKSYKVKYQPAIEYLCITN